jgi:HEAT repeat protein
MLPAMLVISCCGCATEPAPDTGSRVRHWIEALHGPDAKVRKEAAFKLGNLGLTEPAAVVPALTIALKDADAQVRCEAILALLKCGPGASDAVPVLTQLQRHDRDPRVRTYAARALEKLRREEGL